MTIDPEPGSVFGAQDAAVLGDDALTDREPEAGAARLGGEEGLEDPAEVLGLDARTLVADVDAQELLAAVRAAQTWKSVSMRVLMVMVPPGGDTSTALRTRLSSTWVSCPASPSTSGRLGSKRARS